MPLEQATNIAQLDDQWPTGNDPVDRGDDHIRLIKSVLKKTFPGPAGKGFTVPLTVDPAILNALAARLTAIEKSIKDVHPIGYVMLRLDSVNPGTIFGGTWTNITMDATLSAGTPAQAGTHAGANAVTVPLPSHTHTATIAAGGGHHHAMLNNDVQSDHDEFSHPPTAANHLIKRFSPDGWDLGYTFKASTNIPTLGLTGDGGNHTHTATVASAGVASPTIDVRGQRLFVAIWKRTS